MYLESLEQAQKEAELKGVDKFRAAANVIGNTSGGGLASIVSRMAVQ